MRTLLVSLLAVAACAFPLQAAVRNGLVLSTAPEDPALIDAMVRLGPGVNPEEARRISAIAYRTGREMAKEWRMVGSPIFNNFLINIGARQAGYCFQFAHELLARLETQKLKTVDLHWAESDAGTDTEHNVIVVTAKGQPFSEGIMLDNWRHAGHLLWGRLDVDPSHKWNENKPEFERRSRTVPPTRHG